MKWKLKIKKILECYEDQSGEEYFKVDFYPSWIPSTALQSITSLIDEYWRTKEIQENETKSDADKKAKDVNREEYSFDGENLKLNGNENAIMVVVEKDCDFGVVKSKVEDKDNTEKICSTDLKRQDYLSHSGAHLFEIACPKCRQAFKTFVEYRTHSRACSLKEMTSSHECDYCQRRFTSKNIFDKHYKLHLASNRRQKSYGKKLISTRKYASLHTSGNKSLGALTGHSRTCTFSQQTFVDSTSRSYASLPEKELKNTFTEQRDKQATGFPNQSKKADNCQPEEFTPEVLQSARSYIKSVSVRRKRVTQIRQQLGRHHIGGIGVDVELRDSEDAVPITSVVNGKHCYECKVCNKRFFNKFHHREHFNIHSGETPYLCEFCAKRFAQRSGWNRHIKLHHKYGFFNGPIQKCDTSNGLTACIKGTLSVIKSNRTTATNSSSSCDLQTVANISLSNSSALISTPPLPTNLLRPVVSSPTTYLPISPAKGIKVPEIDKPSLPSLTEDVQPTTTNFSIKQAVFQCKKVRAMDSTLIFMIRVSLLSQWQHDSLEFAYILDDVGQILSRIYINDYPGGDWLDFPLDESSNEALLERVRAYDACNKRGPKPQHTSERLKQGNVSYKNTMDKVPTSNALWDLEPKNTSLGLKSSTEQSVSPDSIPSSLKHSLGSEESTGQSNQGRIFRSGKAKRFQCGECGRRFLAQAHLKDHMLIHTGEHPFKCIFCGRPFRHKSGLNSHHKRHIQKGVFNQPISRRGNDAACGLGSLHQFSTHEHINAVTKAKRKNSHPKQYVKHAANDSDTVVHIKDEKEDENFDGRRKFAMQSSDILAPLAGESSYPVTMAMSAYGKKSNILVKNDKNLFSKETSNGEGVECNFCSFKFATRTAYLKHVNAAHKRPRHDYINSNCPSTFRDELYSSRIDTSDIERNGEMENLFLDVKIKEETIDADY